MKPAADTAMNTVDTVKMGLFTLYISLGIFLRIGYLSALSTTADPRWLLLPDRNVKVVIGTRMSLFWRYRLPSMTHKEGQLLFSHRHPEKSHEDILIRGSVEPTSGAVTVTEVMYPDRVSLITDPGKIRVDMLVDSMYDAGSYMLDIDFAGATPVYDLIRVEVYEEPSMLQVPRRENLVKVHDHLSLIWRMSRGQRDPPIHSITIYHTNLKNRTKTIAESIRNYGLSTWDKAYPSGETDGTVLVFEPEGPLVTLSLWDVATEEAGLYTIKVLYEDNVYELEHSSWVYAPLGIEWEMAPHPEVYAMESNDLHLVYVPRIPQNVTDPVRMVLCKVIGDKFVELISITYDIKPSHTRYRRSSDPRVQVRYDHEQSQTSFTIRDAQINDSGTYHLKMYVAYGLVRIHNVTVKVLTGEQVQPVFKLDNNVLTREGNGSYAISPGQLVIIIPVSTPNPHMELYSLKNGQTLLYVKGYNVSFLEIMVTHTMLENEVITLGVYYGFYSQRYHFTTDATTGAYMGASASLIGILILIPLFIILIILIVCLVLYRKRKKERDYKSIAMEPAESMKTSMEKSSIACGEDFPDHGVVSPSARIDSSSQTSADRDEGYYTNNYSRPRDSYTNPGTATYRDYKQTPRRPVPAKLSLVVERNKVSGDSGRTSPASMHDDAFNRKRSSFTSDTSNVSRGSKSTFIVKTIYMKRSPAPDMDQSYGSSLGRQLSSPSLTATWNRKNTPAFRYDDHSTPRSNLPTSYSKSQDDQLDAREVFPDNLGPKPKSTSTLPNIKSDGASTPYTIHSATGDRIYNNTLPAFLVKYRLRSDENNQDTGSQPVSGILETAT